MTMTPKQKRFCQEYLISLNATEAAIKAGYAKKSARSIGQENLTKPDIKNYIDEKLQEIEDSKIMDAKEVMERLTAIGRREVSEHQVVSYWRGRRFKENGYRKRRGRSCRDANKSIGCQQSFGIDGQTSCAIHR